MHPESIEAPSDFEGCPRSAKCRNHKPLSLHHTLAASKYRFVDQFGWRSGLELAAILPANCKVSYRRARTKRRGETDRKCHGSRERQAQLFAGF